MPLCAMLVYHNATASVYRVHAGPPQRAAGARAPARALLGGHPPHRRLGPVPLPATPPRPRTKTAVAGHGALMARPATPPAH